MTQWDQAMPDKRIQVRVHPDMQSIVPEFLSNALEDVRVLRHAIEHSDFDAIARLGHSIKGACGFGFDYLGDAGASLEHSARAKDLFRIRQLVDEVEDYLNNVEPVYKAG